MKQSRPNLVNPQLWSPFKAIPTPIPTSIPTPIPTPPILPSSEIPIPVPQVLIQGPISRREIIQRNSFYLNLFGLIIMIGIGYFFYSIYLERKIFSEYLDLVKNVQEEHYPGFL